MNSHHQPEILEDWIARATDGLISSARERIASEIEAHFAESVEDFMSEGLTKEDAESKALRNLGDLNRASKNFQKAYLTENDIKWLTKFESGIRLNVEERPGFHVLSTFFLLLATVIIGWLCWSLSRPDLGPPRYIPIAFLIQAVLWIYCHWRKAYILKNFADKFCMWRGLMTLRFVEISAATLTGIVLTIMSALDHFLPIYALIMITLCSGKTWRIWLKLRDSFPQSIPAA